MKKTLKHVSIVIAAFAWLLLFALTIFIIWGMRDRARLIRDNDNERILNTLWTSLRGYDDIGEAIESNPVLKERIKGFAVYGDNLAASYQWGQTPRLFDENILDKNNPPRFNRYTIPYKHGGSVKFIISSERTPTPPPPKEPAPENDGDKQERRRQRTPRQSFFPNSIPGGKYIYIDISHSAYWRTQTLTAVAVPICALLFLFLVIYIRRLYLRNREYRERIEAQQNLVVLGTAASTLAHEIKNPLLSIRLQTGILRKIAARINEAGMITIDDELSIIEEEVDRISALIYRVNDYLREAKGNCVAVNVCALLADTSMRLCNRNILQVGGAKAGIGGTDKASPAAVGNGAKAADAGIADRGIAAAGITERGIAEGGIAGAGIAESGMAGAAVFMDADRLRSVLENVIRNALEAGGPEAAVTASVEKVKTGGRALIVISIIDQGKGISGENLKRVFDPFFTSKSTGTGIGLSICKRFVEAANGYITLENREAGGVKVTIALPEWTGEEG
jgi:signal transduction histidine kinase